jgi:hypothetical protein
LERAGHESLFVHGGSDFGKHAAVSQNLRQKRRSAKKKSWCDSRRQEKTGKKNGGSCVKKEVIFQQLQI